MNRNRRTTDGLSPVTDYNVSIDHDALIDVSGRSVSVCV